MKKFDGYLMCSDLDGTLTCKGEMSLENANAIKYFQENGGLFTVATGRSPSYLNNFRKIFIPNTYIIAINGTMIYDIENEKIVYSSYLDENAEDVLAYIDEHFDFVKRAHISTASETFVCEKSNESYKDACSKIEKPWYKIIFCQGVEETAILKEQLIKNFSDRYNFNQSWATGLEMISKESGKGECVLKLKQLLNKEIHTTICVGDYENDLSMLKIADISYAVGNAIDLVKKSASRITVKNTENAIAKIIYEL